MKKEVCFRKKLPHGAVVDAYNTYDHALQVQHLVREREVLIAEVRRGFFVAVDNSWFE